MKLNQLILISASLFIQIQTMELDDEFKQLSCDEKKELYPDEKKQKCAQKEWEQLENLPSYCRELILTLKTMQKKSGVPHDIISLIAPYFIRDNAQSSEARLALLCHMHHCKMNMQLAKKAFIQSNIWYDIPFKINFVRCYKYESIIPFLNRFETSILNSIIHLLDASADTTDPISIDHLKLLCNISCEPKNALWEFVLFYAMTKVCNFQPKEKFKNLIKKIILEKFVDINIQDFFTERTILMHAAGQNDLEFLKWLLEYGADKTLQDNDGSTALIHAACGDRSNFFSLLSHTTIINHKNDSSVSALSAVISDNKYGAVEILLQLGAIFDFDTFTKLQYIHNIDEFINRFKIDITMQNNNGDTLLFRASSLKLATFLEKLLALKLINIDHQNKQGRTALMDAQYLEMGILFLKAGANPNIQDHDGNTGMHLLVTRYHDIMNGNHIYNGPKKSRKELINRFINSLQEHNADFSIKNHEGKTAKDMAQEMFANKWYGTKNPLFSIFL